MSPLAAHIVRELEERPRHFSEIVESHLDVPWRDFLGAWGEVRAADILQRDDGGHYLVPKDGPPPGSKR